MNHFRRHVGPWSLLSERLLSTAQRRRWLVFHELAWSIRSKKRLDLHELVRSYIKLAELLHRLATLIKWKWMSLIGFLHVNLIEILRDSLIFTIQCTLLNLIAHPGNKHNCHLGGATRNPFFTAKSPSTWNRCEGCILSDQLGSLSGDTWGAGNLLPTSLLSPW